MWFLLVTATERLERPKYGTGLQAPCRAESEVEEGVKMRDVTSWELPLPGLGPGPASSDRFQTRREQDLAASPLHSKGNWDSRSGAILLFPQLLSPDGAGGGNAGEQIHREVAAGSRYLTFAI